MSLEDDLQMLARATERVAAHGALPPGAAADIADLVSDPQMARYAPPGSVARSLLGHVAGIADAAANLMAYVNEVDALNSPMFEQQNELNMMITTLDEEVVLTHIGQWYDRDTGRWMYRGDDPMTLEQRNAAWAENQRILIDSVDVTHSRRTILDNEITGYVPQWEEFRAHFDRVWAAGSSLDLFSGQQVWLGPHLTGMLDNLRAMTSIDDLGRLCLTDEHGDLLVYIGDTLYSEGDIDCPIPNSAPGTSHPARD